MVEGLKISALINRNITYFHPFSNQRWFNNSLLPLLSPKHEINKEMNALICINRHRCDGLCKDEGSLFVLILKPDILTKIVTLNDHKKFLDKYKTLLSINESFSDELIRYYTRNTKMENSMDVKWRLFDMIGDLTIKCPTYFFAKRYAERSVNRSKVFFYELTRHTRSLLGRWEAIPAR